MRTLMQSNMRVVRDDHIRDHRRLRSAKNVELHIFRRAEPSVVTDVIVSDHAHVRLHQGAHGAGLL